MSGRTNRAETLKAPRHSSTLPRLTFHCSFICLMFSIQRKWLQSNQKTQLNILFSVFTSFKIDVPIFPEINSLIHVWKYNFPKTDSPIFDTFTEKDKHILNKQATRSNQLPLSRLVELRLTVKQKRSLSFVRAAIIRNVVTERAEPRCSLSRLPGHLPDQEACYPDNPICQEQDQHLSFNPFLSSTPLTRLQTALCINHPKRAP